MKYITTETAENIRNAMTMAAITTTYDLFPNLSQVNHEHIARMVDSAFETWCQIEDIKVVETDEPEYPEVRIFFDDTKTEDYKPSQWDDDCDYEVGYDPYLGCFTDDV